MVLIAVAIGASPAKKLEITAEEAKIHLEPSERSPVIATLDQGTHLTRGSPLKFKKIWLYVYFKSVKNGKSKSGYVRASMVKKLFQNTRVLEIRDF